MARQRVAYTGDPEKDWRDVGPAAAGAVDGLAAVGRLTATAAQEYLQADMSQAAGAGPVERRRLTPAELAAREAANQQKAQPPLRERPGPGASFTPRQRPVEPVAIPSQREETVIVIQTPTVAPPEIPCGGCIHDVVCGLKASIPATAEPRAITAGFPDGIRMYVSAYRIECDHFHSKVVSIETRVTATAAVAEVEPIRREHGGESWRTQPEPAARVVRSAAPEELAPRRVVQTPEEIAESRRRGTAAAIAARGSRFPLGRNVEERNAKVFEALRTTSSLAEAASKLQVSQNRVSQIITETRRAGTMPEDVIAMLDMRNPSKRKAVAS